MFDYQAQYATLVGAISDALDCLKPLPINAQSIQILQQAIQAAEEAYLKEDV